jgi:POT family proton-dependent oligopeptide transporter
MFNGKFELNGETMQGSGAVLVMIWIPILTLGIYPLLARLGWRPTALRRMSLGMLLGAVSFVLCGLIQARMDHGEKLSIAWQLVPYIVLEAGEVMLSATALEFAFEQAPKQMKSVIMSFWLMTIAGGHFLIAVFTNLNSRFVHARGAAEFYFYAVLMLVVAGLFIFLATRYRGRQSLAK